MITTKPHPRTRRIRGVSLIETIVSLTLLVSIMVITMQIVVAARRGADAVIPPAEHALAAESIKYEMSRTIADADSQGWYADADATFVAGRTALAASSTTSSTNAKGDGGTTPPKGGDDGGGTKPPKGDDPTPPVPSIPVSSTVTVVPVAGYGHIRLGGVAIVGPVVVAHQDSLLFSDQAGDAISCLRYAAGPSFALGSPYAVSAGYIRLVARTDDDAARILALRAGNVLTVNGKGIAGFAKCVIAELTATPELVSVPSASTDGEALFRYYDAAVKVGGPYKWGLNTDKTYDPNDVISIDGTVGLLGPSGGVVSYYTTQTRASGGGGGKDDDGGREGKCRANGLGRYRRRRTGVTRSGRSLAQVVALACCR